jgi:hypothetical protein
VGAEVGVSSPLTWNEHRQWSQSRCTLGTMSCNSQRNQACLAYSAIALPFWSRDMYFNSCNRVSTLQRGCLRAWEQTYVGSVRDCSGGRHDCGFGGVVIGDVCCVCGYDGSGSTDTVVVLLLLKEEGEAFRWEGQRLAI